MRRSFSTGLVAIATCAISVGVVNAQVPLKGGSPDEALQIRSRVAVASDEQTSESPDKEQKKKKVNAKKVIRSGIEWLVEAQQPGGGWGAGSHSRQDVRDPSAVPADPATTAFAATALLKAGHTPISGKYRDSVMEATRYLVKVVEDAEPKSPKITQLTGTQPQTKLGDLIDTAMTAQFLTRVSEHLPPGDPINKSVDDALTECLRRLEETQGKDGSWSGGGGWAPVLQSSLNCTSLELARAAGRKVDVDKLEKARDYQKKNIDASTGRAASSAAAGVELYAFAGGIRGNAADASIAQQVIEDAKKEGKLSSDAPVNEENLRIAGEDEMSAKKLSVAQAQNAAQVRRLNDEQLLSGFGNNGGEEFLSYLMTSESLVIAGGDAWDTWNEKMKDRLGKIQNEDGSWSGHHCITSPVFCTAASLQVLTTERDVKTLKRVAELSKKRR